MELVYLILTVFAVSNFVFCQVGADKCACREYRCLGNEHSNGTCQMWAAYAGHGTSCCKPYCTCKESCSPGESNVGRNRGPSLIEENKYYGWRWEYSGTTGDEAADNCPVNQTFCCPSCLCRNKCKVAEENIANGSCAINDVLCCTNQTRNWRCNDDEILFGKLYSERYCGRCLCRKTCTTGETQQQNNQCQQNHKLCCKTCSCKTTCTEGETVMNHGKCSANNVMCCEECKCKTGCDVTERDQGKGTCQYGLTRCCYP